MTGGEVEVGSMIIVGRIDQDQIMLSMEGLRDVMKQTRGTTESLAGDVAKLSLAAGMAGFTFGLFAQATENLFQVSKISPAVSAGLQSVGLALMNLGMTVGPVVQPILQSFANLLTQIAEGAKPIVDLIINSTWGSEFLEKYGASIIGAIATFWKTGSVPAALAVGLSIDIITNWESMGYIEKLITAMVLGGTVGSMLGGLPGAAIGAIGGIGFVFGEFLGEVIVNLIQGNSNTGSVS